MLCYSVLCHYNYCILLKTFQAIDRDIGNGSTVNYAMREGNRSIFDVATNGTVSAKPMIIDSRNGGHYTIIIDALNEEEPYTKCDNINCTQNITVYLQVGC